MATIEIEDRRLAQGGVVRILQMVAPPTNALSAALRAALAAALEAAIQDPLVRGIVLAGAQGSFSAGLEPTEVRLAQDAPRVAALAQTIAASPKPVIAALEGLVFSAAADLALAAHGRVAGESLRIGWREAMIGQLPCAGATQRLPALVGAETAIALLRGATTMGARQALAAGLVDMVVPGDVLAAAVAQLPAVSMMPRQPGLRDGRAFQAALAAAAQGADAGLQRLLSCVAAAQVLPAEQGFAFEAAAAAEMAALPRAAALRHAMLADLRLAAYGAGGKVAGHIALWGTDALALPALRAGLTVTVADTDRTALVARLEALALAQEADVQAGRLTPAAREAEWARVIPATSAPVADLVIAARDGAGGAVMRLGPVQGDLAKGDICLLLPARGVAEVQTHDGADMVVSGAVATLRRMGLRVAVTGPSSTGVLGAMTQAAARALRAMVAQGIGTAALTAGMPTWLRVAVPPSTGHGVVDPGTVEARIIGALVAAGARLLATGVVQAASDIDALVLAGLQMPRDQGGPMYQADQRGLLIVRRDLALWAADDAVWQPTGLFDDLIAAGKGFTG